MNSCGRKYGDCEYVYYGHHWRLLGTMGASSLRSLVGTGSIVYAASLPPPSFQTCPEERKTLKHTHTKDFYCLMLLFTCIHVYSCTYMYTNQHMLSGTSTNINTHATCMYVHAHTQEPKEDCEISSVKGSAHRRVLHTQSPALSVCAGVN